MEYDVNRIEFVKTHKTKYVIQTSKHFQICIDYIIHNDVVLKDIFSICSYIFCEIVYLLHCFLFTELKCFEHLPHWWCVYFQILYNTMDFYKWKLNLIPMKLQINYLEKGNWAYLPKHWCAINKSYKVLHMQW